MYWVEARHTRPFWNVCRHDLIREIGQDGELFTTEFGVRLNSAAFVAQSGTSRYNLSAQPLLDQGFATPGTARQQDSCRPGGSARSWPTSGGRSRGRASACTTCAAICSTGRADPRGPSRPSPGRASVPTRGRTPRPTSGSATPGCSWLCCRRDRYLVRSRACSHAETIARQALSRASARPAGSVKQASWLPGAGWAGTPRRSAKRAQPYSPGGSATSSVLSR